MGTLQAARGFVLCAAWYYSILSGFYLLYCPVIYLMIINHKLYRYVVDELFALWELYPVALFQCCHKMQLHHYGDYVNANEKAILIMNHRTRVDWNYIWIALYHATRHENNDNELKTFQTSFIKLISNKFNFGGQSKIKFVLKDEIRNLPGLGWIMQLNYFLYIKRDWREDERRITQFVDYYNKIESSFRLLLFPEGTDFTENNCKRSHRFAISNSLPLYTHLLHPRTTGWSALCSQLLESGLEAVYDITVVYDTPPQTEMDMICGRLPKHAYFYFRRYSVQQLPSKTDNDLRDWLNDRWLEKERNLQHYHNHGVFAESAQNKTPILRKPKKLLAAKISFVFWNTIQFIFTYLLIKSSWFQFWVIYNSLLSIFVSWYFGGFHNLQYKLL